MPRHPPQSKVTRAEFEEVNRRREAIKIPVWPDDGTGFLDEPVKGSVRDVSSKQLKIQHDNEGDWNGP